MKVIIAGGRDYNNYSELERYCDTILANQKDIEIVSGIAKGADSLGERYAKERNIPVKRFPADWDMLGKSAGYIRNKEMAVYADAVILFWDGKSKGTGHMLDLAKKWNLKIRVIYYNNKP